MKKLTMRRNTYPGLLITFCGLDGCGKSTMIARIADYYKKAGEQIFLTKQPTDFVRHSKIFRTYMDQENHDAYDYRSLSLLAASDRLQHVSHEISPVLSSGNWVISDRYFYSCIANLIARGYSSDRWIYEIAEHIIQPDLPIFLDVPVETAIGRVRSRPEEADRYIDMELQYSLRECYTEICKKCGGLLLSTLEPPDSTFEKIIYEIERVRRKK